MVALLVTVILNLALSWLLGSALWRLGGLAEPSPAVLPLGFAALLVLAGLIARLSHGPALGAVAIGVLSMAAVLGLRRTGGVPAPPRWIALTAAGVTGVALIPFLAAGRVGLLGAGTNDDMVEHLLTAWTLQGNAASGSDKLIVSGYPIAPHGLAATFSTVLSAGLEPVFTGMLICVPVALALGAAALLPGRPVLRALGGALTGLCYLQAAYLVQSSFKEPLESMLLVAWVAALVAARPASQTRWRLFPLATLLAACVYVNSYLGLVWPLGALAVVVGARQLGAGGSLRVILGRLGRELRAAAPAGLAFVLLIAPEVPRLAKFGSSGYNHEASGVLGDLLGGLSPMEALGVWPRLDFRFPLPGASFGGVLAIVAAAAAVVAIVITLRRREFDVLAALLISAAIVVATLGRSPYTEAKALVIGAPWVTLLLVRMFIGLEDWTPRRRAVRWGTAGVLAAILLTGAYSSLELLRDAPVNPGDHAAELAGLRTTLSGRPTLYLGNDDLIRWELRGSELWTPPEALYARDVVPLRYFKAQPGAADLFGPRAPLSVGRFAGLGLAIDFDSVPTAWLDRFQYVVMPRSGYTSPAPRNWSLIRRTRSYGLWRRTGPTQPYRTLRAIDDPGSVLDCTTPPGHHLAGQPGEALIQPAPVVGERTGWRGSAGVAGHSARQTLVLGRGVWRLSLQYDGAVGVRVAAGRLRADLPPVLEPVGTYWNVGPLRVAHAGPVVVVVRWRPLSAVARVLGAIGLTRAPAPTGLRPLGRVVATRPASAAHWVPLARACGRYIDRYQLTSEG